MANLADFVSTPPAFITELLSPQTSDYYPISLEGKWDFEVVRFSVHYYYTCS